MWSGIMHLFHLNNLKWVIHSPEYLIKILGSLPAGTVEEGMRIQKRKERERENEEAKPAEAVYTWFIF